MTVSFKLKPVRERMGKVLASVTVSNFTDSSKSVNFIGLVDTGSTYLTLPSVWKDKLGELEKVEEVQLEMASGEIRTGEIYGAVQIKIDNFRQIISEVLFIEMEADEDGNYEPLIGYLPLESIPAGVDMLNHRLVKAKALLK
jgi:hypothetical protein